jgi:hypothetical protein
MEGRFDALEEPLPQSRHRLIVPQILSTAEARGANGLSRSEIAIAR